MSKFVRDGKKFLILDVETTSENDGHPFDPSNSLLFVGTFDGECRRVWDVEFTEKPYGQVLADIRGVLDQYDCIVAFNAKFDLHWLRRYGLDLRGHSLYDLQFAEFCLSGQTWKFPDCDTACKNRGLQGKLPFDFSQTHTREEWETYLCGDLDAEGRLLEAQFADLDANPSLQSLVWWGCQDIKVTQEMEWNGLLYDAEKSYQIGDKLLHEVALIDMELYNYAPWPYFSWASNDNVSAILYGGVFKYIDSEPFTFTYKDGRTKEKVRNVVKELQLPRLVEPLKGSENKKEGYFSTDDGTLAKLKAVGAAREIVSLLRTRRALTKKVGTYYHGIPQLAEKMGWTNQILHGQLNHCVAATGRLSSSKPNLQNLEAQMRQCVVSRFPLTKNSLSA